MFESIAERRRRRRAQKAAKKKERARETAAECCAPDCDCDPGFLMISLMCLTALLNYSNTAPVAHRRRTTRPLLRLIRSYQQHVSARRPAVCNLSPTCSAYGYEAVRDHGLRGLVMTKKRTRQCRDQGQQNRAALA